MMYNLNIDTPIDSAKQDIFGRAEFAKQIAAGCGKATGNSTVIGIYGKWGEGKTSLLNMVGGYLNAEILQINFNPWLFKDDEDLLQAFFKMLASALGRKLTTNVEMARNIVSDYSESLKILSVIPKYGFVSTILKGVAKLFKRPSLLTSEKAKSRVNDFIIDSKLNIVIFIDDIDRLDAREVSTVFKLVKLLADFPRTTYILSFDHDIVARMLAPHYGGNGQQSGYDFLEKVIQLPLVLPKAHNHALLGFVREAITQVIAASGTQVSIDDKRLQKIFADGLMVLLNNPRKIVRFANTFKFTLPILLGEINFIDLLIIEAFKASLPDYYSFIRENEDLFLTDYSDKNISQYTTNPEVADVKIKAAIQPYSGNVRSAIKGLTNELFPYFIWRDATEAKRYDRDKLVTQKRICTYEYFARYFTFSLQNEEISDIHFSKHYLNASDHSIDQLTAYIEKDYNTYSPETVASKVAPHRKDIKNQDAENLILALGLTSNLIENKRAYEWGGSFSQISLSVEAMVKGLSPERSFAVAKQLISTATSLIFAAELTASFVMPEWKENQRAFFSGVEAIALKEVYINRLKDLMQEKGFFEAIPEEMMIRQLVWWDDVDRTGLKGKISDLLGNDPSAPLRLLRIFTPTLYSSKTGDGFKTDFTEEEFMLVERIIGATALYYGLLLRHGDQSTRDSVQLIAYHQPVDDKTLIGKFQWLYQLRSGILEQKRPQG